jgi:hypothetical protein
MSDVTKEAKFTREFFVSLRTIEASIGSRSRMRQMIERYGGNVVEAWKHLKSDITYGFYELAENGLLEYSIEYQMLRPEWRDIRTGSTRGGCKIARRSRSHRQLACTRR